MRVFIVIASTMRAFIMSWDVIAFDEHHHANSHYEHPSCELEWRIEHVPFFWMASGRGVSKIVGVMYRK